MGLAVRDAASAISAQLGFTHEAGRRGPVTTGDDKHLDGEDRSIARRLNRRRFLGLTAAGGLGLILVACGDDDDDGGTTSAAPAESSAAASSAAPATSEAATSEAATSAAETTAAEETTAAAETAAAGGDTPATRAIAGLAALGLESGFTITVFSEDLSILAAEVTKDKFEQESGLKLDIQKAPFLEYAAKVLNDATTKSAAYDVVLMETNRMGDLDNAGYLADLSEYATKYNPDLEDMISPQAQVWSQYNGKFVGIPTDGDVFMFYYRKDKLEDPAEQEAFSAKYGKDLAVPATYEDYREVVEFFTRPDENFYGAAEWRVKGVAYWWFWQRLWSNGGTYFNEDMTRGHQQRGRRQGARGPEGPQPVHATRRAELRVRGDGRGHVQRVGVLEHHVAGGRQERVGFRRTRRPRACGATRWCRGMPRARRSRCRRRATT